MTINSLNVLLFQFGMSVVPCPILTVASWPAYRFLRRQIRWSGIPISWRIFHSWLWFTQSKASALSIKQKYVFLELSCFFDDPTNVGKLISDSSAFSKSSLNIWKFTVHILLKPGLENFEDYFASVRWVQLCSSLNILWLCLSLELEWKLTFSSPVATAEFSKFAGTLNAALLQHHLLGFEIPQLELHHLH